MKTTISSIFFYNIGFCLLLLCSSCIKDLELDSSKSTKITSRWNFEDYKDVISESSATRKLLELKETDVGSGASKSTYDCTRPGKSCDVGETPKKSKGFLVRPLPENVTFTENVLTADSAEYFLPLFFEEPIYSDLQDNVLELKHEGGYLVLKDTATWTALFAYEIDGPQYAAFSGTAEYRVMKKNLETNINECKEAGHNCKVSTSFSTSMVSLVQLYDSSFPNNDIYENIEDSFYACRKEGFVYGLIPTNGSGLDTFYLDLSN